MSKSSESCLSVVVPAYNEGEGLRALHARLVPVLEALDVESRIVLVDDGSSDQTWAVMRDLAQADPRVETLKLARNFGKELALTAGLDHVRTGAAVVIDADLQDPPELIPLFVERWRDGHDVVYGRRIRRAGESWLKRATAAAFYRLIGWLSPTPIPRDTGDFRLLSRRALDALAGVRERQRFMKGLFSWVGFRQCAIDYEREPRHAGRSRFNYWKLWNFAIEGITGFSTVPLRMATYVGLLTALVAFGFGVWIVAKTLLWGEPVAGYPSLMAAVLFLGGVQLIALGVIGEYLGRLYMESKQRPLYLVEEWCPASGDRTATPSAVSSLAPMRSTGPGAPG
ncbi:MAG TPA: glycosyltransferase family 2 protein [Xanthomonadaceae bacterium]|nr:glycosyltransferase family 2 protein [Xanthomonadaceae bacterium]